MALGATEAKRVLHKATVTFSRRELYTIAMLAVVSSVIRAIIEWKKQFEGRGGEFVGKHFENNSKRVSRAQF